MDKPLLRLRARAAPPQEQEKHCRGRDLRAQPGKCLCPELHLLEGYFGGSEQALKAADLGWNSSFFTSCVTLGVCLTPSVPQFFTYRLGIRMEPTSYGCFED